MESAATPQEPNHRNRPVHLARRDAYFERAMDLLSRPMDGLDSRERLECVSQISASLNKARDHAFFAARPECAGHQEAEFHHFLDLKLKNVDSAIAMIQHQIELEQEEGFLCRFLRTTTEECRMPALQYRRRAEDILQGLWHMLRLAHSTYFALRQANLAELCADEQARYQRAYASFQEEARQRFPIRPSPPAAEATS